MLVQCLYIVVLFLPAISERYGDSAQTTGFYLWDARLGRSRSSTLWFVMIVPFRLASVDVQGKPSISHQVHWPRNQEFKFQAAQFHRVSPFPKQKKRYHNSVVLPLIWCPETLGIAALIGSEHDVVGCGISEGGRVRQLWTHLDVSTCQGFFKDALIHRGRGVHSKQTGIGIRYNPYCSPN